jgi:hypothetical protein
LLIASLLAGPARGERTKLLEADLKTGAVRRIDAAGPTTAADRDLDAMLDKATGGAAFSTAELERIEKALRRFLEAARPRAAPRLLLFLYPGRISRNSLKELREVNVEVELLVDPCSRTVCSDSVGKTLELVGRALRQPVLRTSRYTVRFGAVTIRTSTEMKGQSFDLYRYQAAEVVRAGQQPAGGATLVKRLQEATASYARQMTQEVARRLQLRRVKLGKPPQVQHEPGAVSVDLEIRSDRVRYKSDVLASLVGTAEALRASPVTPPSTSIQVVAQVPFRTVERKSFRCTGQPLGLFLDGRLGQAELWSTYIVEKTKGGTRLTFDDGEASGRTSVEDSEEGDDRTNEVLAAHMSLLGPCLTAEAARNPRFKGVTITFAVTASGRAVQVGARESGTSSSLKSCLAAALGKIQFQRHSGAPRQVSYPMLIRR